MRQTSPACAATSVAGAWNALCCGGRHGAGALRQDHVVAHLKDILQEQIASKRARFERLLGASIADFEAALDEVIAADPGGKSLGGKSKAEPGLKRGELMRMVVELANGRGAAELGDVEAAVAGEEGGRGDMLTSFGSIAALIRDDAAAGLVFEAGGADDKEDDDENEPIDENSGSGGGSGADALADELVTGIDMDSCGGGGGGGFGTSLRGKGGAKGKGGGGAAGARWDWRKDLHEILKKRGGLEKLNRPKPSTGRDTGAVLTTSFIVYQYSPRQWMTFKH